MIANKYINKIVAAIMAVVVLMCSLGVVYYGNSDVETEGIKQEYEEKLFNTENIIDINIIMDDEEWENLLENAINEEYTRCDVEINGESFYGVGIRPKGNTSLTSIVSDPTTDRYSLKLEFDHYVEGQTCYGLDKLILNNNYADATNMKEALIYDMFKYMGADASLYNYAKISVNGEYWGVYLALEGVEDSFRLRNYGAADGELYKPENMDKGGIQGGREKEQGGQPPNFGGGFPQRNGGNMQPPQNMNGQQAEGQPPMENGGFRGGGPGGGSGSDLNYTDDDSDSYSTIWEGEITKTSEKDHKKVITALKNISEGVEISKYMDTDNLLKYMAVHIFSVNQDSLSGNMAHNYYLYENKGQLNILPWDYNLAFGGMGRGGNDASSTVNSPIDMAFNGTEFFDCLYENEEYLSEYHENMERLVTEYVEGGGLDEFYNRTRSLIDELVKTDPTTFYTYDEYNKAAETLYKMVKLRGESVKGQLEGTIPSTSGEQREDSSALIDTKDLDLTVMGTMNNRDRQLNGADEEEDREKMRNGQGRENFHRENAGNMQNTDIIQAETGTKGTVTLSGDTKKSLAFCGISLFVLVVGVLFALLFKEKIRRR